MALQTRLYNLWKNNKYFIVFILMILGLRVAIADFYYVPTGSMLPTIVEGDRVSINRVAYDVKIPFTDVSLRKIGNPKRGEIVSFNSAKENMRMIKRVVAVPGDTISMRNNRLTVNGKESAYKVLARNAKSMLLQETTLGSKRIIRVRTDGYNEYTSFPTLVVPKGYYFMLGDNRDESKDSRFIGFVPRGEIIGRSSIVLFSLDHENYFAPRWDRTLQSM